MITWEATSAAINALPEPVRQYIAQLETLCDPSGLVRENMQTRDVQRELSASNKSLRDSIDTLTTCIENLQDELRKRSGC